MLIYFVPLALVLLFVVALALYVLSVALREAHKQITTMNQQLLVMIGVRDGGEEVGRALVALARKPGSAPSGATGPPAKEKERKKPSTDGVTMTIGTDLLGGEGKSNKA